MTAPDFGGEFVQEEIAEAFFGARAEVFEGSEGGESLVFCEDGSGVEDECEEEGDGAEGLREQHREVSEWVFTLEKV